MARCTSIELMKDTLREALTTDYAGLKVVIAEGECMLNRQRRIKPLMQESIESGKRTLRARFVVDTQRLWHVVVHNGDAPRYALITSFESGPELDAWIAREQNQPATV